MSGAETGRGRTARAHVVCMRTVCAFAHSRRRVRASLSALALSSLILALGAPAAWSQEEGPRDTVQFGCTAVTYAFSGFPNASNNAVKELVYVGRTVIASAVFSFDGPSGSNTVPVVVPAGHHPMDARALWRTNGVHGGHDKPLRGGITCPAAPALSLEKRQRLAGRGAFTSEALAGEVGEVVEYDFLARNTGNVPLALSPLSDERCDPGTLAGGTGGALAPQGSASYTCSHLLTGGDAVGNTFVNSASLTGTPPTGEGPPVTATSNVVEVALDRAVSVRAQAVHAVEGQSFAGPVAAFNDPDTSGEAADYAATIDWGDGTASAGTITGAAGSFGVTGSHTYAEEGSHTVTVTVTDADSGQSSSDQAGASVDDGALGAGGVVAATGSQSFSGSVATLIDENSAAPAGEFSATVEWGDGTSSGAAVGGGGGHFLVTGSHTYGPSGEYKVKVHIGDAGGARTSATSAITVLGGAHGAAAGSSSTPGRGPAIGVLPFKGLVVGLPAPVFGRTANVIPIAGAVLVRTPGSTRFLAIHAATSVPLGTVIDATRGQARLVTAADIHSRTVESGIFYGGAFRVSQIVIRVHGRPIALTVLTLAGPLPKGCTAKRAQRASLRALSARSRGTSRKLWGNAKGNFRTVGRYAAATVRGTKWLTEDKCAGTLVYVARGIVSVKDFPHRRAFALRAGHSVVAHPGRGG